MTDISQTFKALIQAARRQPVDTDVPFGFEQRLMARLRALPLRDPLADWMRVFSRAAYSGMALSLFVAVVAVESPVSFGEEEEPFELGTGTGDASAFSGDEIFMDQ